MKTASTSQNSKACPFETWPQTCRTGAIQGVCFLPHLSTSTAASDRRCITLQATDWNSRDFFDNTRGSFVMTSPPHPVAHSPGERQGTGSCSAGPRRRRSAPGTRWSCSESRPSPQASRFPGRRSAWLPGSQRHIPGKKKEKENNKLAQNCTSVAAVWIKKKKNVNVFAGFFVRCCTNRGLNRLLNSTQGWKEGKMENYTKRLKNNV